MRPTLIPSHHEPVPPELSSLVADFVRRHHGAYMASAAMLLVIALLTVWLPQQVGKMVDAIAAGTLDAAALTQGVTALLAAGVVIYLLRVGWRMRLYGAAYRMGVELRVRLYQRLLAQGPRFYQPRRTGDLMALATNDVDAVEMACGEALLAGFDGSLTLVLVLAMMTAGVDWRLAAVAMLPFPLMGLAFWWISRHVHDAARDSLARFSDLNDQVQESLAGVRTLRALGLAPRAATQFEALAERAAGTAESEQRWEAAYEPAVGLTLALSTVLSLAYGGALVWQQQLSIGQLTAFSMYLAQLIWPMFAAGWVLALIERGRAAWGRLAPLLSEPLTVDNHGRITAVATGPISLEGLHFAYPGQTAAALADVSFSLPPGRTLGLVGPTGAGKSTLIKLLQRQWAPQTGRITWSGQALADYTLDALRTAVAWVPQEAVLFSASVADNIALGREGVTRAQVEQVARLAAVHEDIVRLPQGYDTPVGERGVTLSGGQRQRVAIARALLADAPLLLLDDALSAVDTETEARILAALRQQRRGRSVVIAGHRLSSLMDADHIVVLHQGRVAEQGSHAQLLAAGGWYATQWRVQQLQASLDEDEHLVEVTPPVAAR